MTRSDARTREVVAAGVISRPAPEFVGHRPVGFLILCIEGSAVEFRRIVITRSARGIGQQVIRQMHKYCVSALGVRRVWLDVFAHNKRGRHVYAKLGYKVVSRRSHEGKELIIMERSIGTNPEGDSALRQPSGGTSTGS